MTNKNEHLSPHGCVIGLDLGTSAVKGVVLDAGGVCARAERAVTYDRPQEGWVEIGAARWLGIVEDVVRELAGGAPGPVRGLAAAGAAGNALLTDTAGTPLTPIVNWMDQRGVGRDSAALAGLSVAEVREVTGWPCVETFPLAQLAWLKEERPEAFGKAARVCMNTDWLTHRLTGQWVMDHSTATTFHLQNQAAGAWHRPFLERFGIEERQLSRLVDSGVVVGAARGGAMGLTAETTVVTGCFDHPAAARAVGVREPGQLLLSCGTSWVGFLPAPTRAAILAAELLCDPFLAPRGGPWGGMFSVPCIGQTIDTYVREVIAPGTVDPYAVFNQLAAAASPGAGGVEIDLREPVHPWAGSPEKLGRAVMEGAARLLNDKLRALAARGFRFTEAVLVGGPSRSRLWTEIIAATTGLRLTAGTAYSGATGAALLAAEGSALGTDNCTR